MTADEIANSRPADRVAFSDWEPVYGRPVRRLIADDVRGVLLPFVASYREVEEEPIVGYRRRRSEFWNVPARAVPVVSEGEAGLVVTTRYEAAQIVGRTEWEERTEAAE